VGITWRRPSPFDLWCPGLAATCYHQDNKFSFPFYVGSPHRALKLESCQGHLEIKGIFFLSIVTTSGVVTNFHWEGIEMLCNSWGKPSNKELFHQNAMKHVLRGGSHSSKACIMEFSRESLQTGRMSYFRSSG